MESDRELAILEDETAGSEPVVSEPRAEKIDIAGTLSEMGHYVSCVADGVTLGIRLEEIPDSRGVHVDVVFVVHLRKMRLGAGPIALKAYLYPIISADLHQILGFVGLGQCLQERVFMTSRGRIRLQVMVHPRGGGASLVHRTTTVYVVTGDAPPATDLSWLTRPSRIVSLEELPIVRASDIRASRKVIEEIISDSKWSDLERAIRSTWYLFFALSILPVLLLAFLTSSDSGIVQYASVVGALLSGIYALVLFLRNGQVVRSAEHLLLKERERLQGADDSGLMTRALKGLEESIEVVQELQGSVAPLLLSCASHLRNGELRRAAELASAVLDECVDCSIFGVVSDSALASADEGLGLFLGLFEALAPHFEREQLALTYVALSSTTSSASLTESELAQHLGTLANALFEAGALLPAAKENVDDLLNEWAMEFAAEALSRELAEESPSEQCADGDAIDETSSDGSQISEEELAVVSLIESQSVARNGLRPEEITSDACSDECEQG